MSDLNEAANARRDIPVSPIVHEGGSPPDRAAFLHAVCMILFIAGSIFVGWLMSPAVPDQPLPVRTDLSQPLEPSAPPPMPQ